MGREMILSIVPFFHSYGLSTCAMTGTAMAATLVLHHRFIPRVVRELMETHRPTVFNAVPAMLSDLNELFRDHPLKHRSLNACMSGGAPLTQSIGEEFSEHTGAIVVEGFGLSEASPVTHAGPLDGTAQPGTIGLPLPDTDVRIVDSETGLTELPVGEVGEMIVRGPQVMLGYWNDPEATDLAIRDGWLYTGDLARMAEDGFFQIVDRKKDLIITSGFNVYPNEVEHILRGCEGVADVAIVGEPDTRRGQIVKAIVVPKSGQTFNMERFQSYAAKHLSKHKVPRLVELSQGDLPRNFLGKVQRRRLRTELTATEGIDPDNEECEAA